MRVSFGAVWLAVEILPGEASVAWAQGALPDPARTPGAINPAIKQDNIGETICVRGWTRTVRPPSEVTYVLKRQAMRAYGYLGQKL